MLEIFPLFSLTYLKFITSVVYVGYVKWLTFLLIVSYHDICCNMFLIVFIVCLPLVMNNICFIYSPGRTSSWIHSKWSILVHCIPGYRVKYFYQKCGFLKQITLPALKKSLERFQQPHNTEDTNIDINPAVTSQDVS